MDPSILMSPDVDYNKALPIQQKRIIAFINHFIMNTVSLLNTFAQSCESRLMEFEFKLCKVDASLKILESQISSIPVENFVETGNETVVENILPEMETSAINESASIDKIDSKESLEISESKPRDDPQYSKYFKMVQVGVPAQAVKLKMMNDGFDPNILDQL